MLFLEFRHIEADKRRFVLEKESGQRLRQLRLTGSGRSEEEEGTHRLPFLVQARARLENGVEHDFYGVILADDPFLQGRLGVDQPVSFFRLHFSQGDARLLRDNGEEVRA